MKGLSGSDKKLLEWIEPYENRILIFFLLVFLFMLATLTYDRYRCSKICLSKGYIDFRLRPEGRFSKSVCYCLAEDDLRVKSKIPKGARVKNFHQ